MSRGSSRLNPQLPPSVNLHTVMTMTKCTVLSSSDQYNWLGLWVCLCLHPSSPFIHSIWTLGYYFFLLFPSISSLFSSIHSHCASVNPGMGLRFSGKFSHCCFKCLVRTILVHFDTEMVHLATATSTIVKHKSCRYVVVVLWNLLYARVPFILRA